MRVTNGIPLGCALLLSVVAVNTEGHSYVHGGTAVLPPYVLVAGQESDHPVAGPTTAILHEVPCVVQRAVRTRGSRTHGCMVPVFRQGFALEDTIELHTFPPLEALTCV